MKRNLKIFIRSFYISAVIMLCLLFGSAGIAKAYSAMRLTAFGEYRQAIDFKDGKLRIFDFEIEF